MGYSETASGCLLTIQGFTSHPFERVIPRTLDAKEQTIVELVNRGTPRDIAIQLLDSYEVPRFKELELLAARSMSWELAEISFATVEDLKKKFRSSSIDPDPHALKTEEEGFLRTYCACMEKWVKEFFDLSKKGAPDMPFEGRVIWACAKVLDVVWEDMGFDVIEGNKFWRELASLLAGIKANETDIQFYAVSLILRFYRQLQTWADLTVLREGLNAPPRREAKKEKNTKSAPIVLQQVFPRSELRRAFGRAIIETQTKDAKKLCVWIDDHARVDVPKRWDKNGRGFEAACKIQAVRNDIIKFIHEVCRILAKHQFAVPE